MRTRQTKKCRLAVGLLWFALGVSALLWRYDARDTLPVADPQLMDENSLASEAQKTCLALVRDTKRVEQSDSREAAVIYDSLKPGYQYMQRIFLVAENKIGGKIPLWAGKAIHIMTNNDEEACRRIQEEANNEHERRKQ